MFKCGLGEAFSFSPLWMATTGDILNQIKINGAFDKLRSRLLEEFTESEEGKGFRLQF